MRLTHTKILTSVSLPFSRFGTHDTLNFLQESFAIMKKEMKRPPIRLGILGGGQLGRMSALAAANLGIKTTIYAPEENSPAFDVTQNHIIADYGDKKALKKFAESVDVVSYEFENIPLETVRYLEKFTQVLPRPALLEVSQHRLKEKQFLNDLGIPTARWAAIMEPQDMNEFHTDHKLYESILKTVRFGYDGKGQARLSKTDDCKRIWKKFKQDIMIAEEVIDFKHEISVIIARDIFGKTAIYDPSRNIHTDHILDVSIVPSGLSEAVLKKARNYTQKIADAVDLVGVLAVEFFVTKDDKVLANEIAPRTHNSGHWTIDACTVSQFENHVRCVCGLPVGSAKRHSNAIMKNLIGDAIYSTDQYLNSRDFVVHNYGKSDAKPGRKMGHVTQIFPLSPLSPKLKSR